MSSDAQQADELLAPPFPRLRDNHVLLNMTLAEALVAFATIAAVLPLWWAGAQVPTFVIGGLGVGSAMVPIMGRTVVGWIPIAGHFMLRSATGQTKYYKRLLAPRHTGTLGLPGDAARLQVFADPVSGAGMIYDPQLKTLTGVARLTHPTFFWQDPTDQGARLAAWETALAGLGDASGLRRLQVLERTVPDGAREVRQWWTLWPDKLTADHWATQVYEQLLEGESTAGGVRHETLTALTLHLGVLSRSISDQGGGMKGAAAVLVQRMNSLRSALESADLHWGGLLVDHQISALVRTVYDPQSALLIEHYEDLDRTIEDAGPMAVKEHWNHLVSDSGYHRVYWIAEWPRRKTHPGFLHPLIMDSTLVRTINHIFEPVPTATSLEAARKERQQLEARAGERAEKGRVTTRAHDRESEDLDRHENDLVAGALELRHAALITVSSLSADDLSRDCDNLVHLAKKAGLSPRVVAGQQMALFAAAALPLGRGFK